MRFLFVFLVFLILEALFLRTLVKPGFIAPDIVFLLLLFRAYSRGREAVLWAIVGGVFLDFTSDNLGLNLFLETFFIYMFLLLHEKFLMRNTSTFLALSGVLLLLKKVSGVVVVSMKFSFSMSWSILLFSWFSEMVALSIAYLLFLKRKE